MVTSKGRTSRGVLSVAAVAGLVAVVALWASGRGLAALGGGLGLALTSTGRLAGLVAAYLLLVQVLLMARVPVIEKVFGQDVLVRVHRTVGFWSFNLMWGHVLIVTVGYALTAHANVLSEGWLLIATYAGMALAAAGTIALTVVAVSSVRRARRRLRYESWHLLHLYAYLGVGLAIPHELWTGQDFQGRMVVQVFWWAAYGIAAGAVLVFRVGVPVWRTVRHGITVTSVTRESPGVVSVRMGGRGLHRLPVRTGQYFVFRFLDGPGWSRGNPFSLSSPARTDSLRITAKDLGDGSGRLAGLTPGTRVLIEGPYGRLTSDRQVGSRVAMLACGIGITPLRALLDDLPYEPGDAVLLYRARTPEDLVFRDELDALAVRRGVRVVYLTGSRDRAGMGWLPAGTPAGALEDWLPRLADWDVFVCGPDAWMDEAAASVLAAGLPSNQLHQERFSW